MSDFVFNVARGRIRYYYEAVDNSFNFGTGVYASTSSAALVVVAVDRGAEADSTFKDFDDLAAILADADIAEVTNSGYARKVLAAGDLAASMDPDTGDSWTFDIPDQTWTGVAAGSPWTDLLTCFRPASGSADSAIVPLLASDFQKTPSGIDLVWQIPSAGLYRSD